MEGSAKPTEKTEGQDKDWINTIKEIRMYSIEQFDKLMVLLSSGGLVLTVGFVKDIVKLNEADHISLLIISWIFFIFTLLSNLISHLISIKSMDLELDGRSKESNDQDKKINCLNYTSLILLILGITGFIVFVSLNIK
jgi:predicted proteasome-type protease